MLNSLMKPGLAVRLTQGPIPHWPSGDFAGEPRGDLYDDCPLTLVRPAPKPGWWVARYEGVMYPDFTVVTSDMVEPA